ncbi:MAG: succinate dehydrogenase assembly factor 2 [Magnetococcales bacterium]|nr:succinate dehydrogenase assembly factor 2 [Magnetococcales bacterium]
MENRETIRKRLIFLAERRSIAEMERVLSRFLAERFAQLTDEECQRVIVLLQQPDWDLLDWLSDLQEPAEGVDREALEWIACRSGTKANGVPPSDGVS